jgi:hypothetical protein
MRRTFLAPALALSCLLGVAGLANCSSPEGEAPEEQLSEDDITGVDNKLGLGLVYDDQAGVVMATLKEAMKDGDQLRLRVRRGRITENSERTLNCAELPEAPATAERRNDRVVYKGPKVAPELLKNFFGPEWYEGEATPAMLEKLAKEGADSIVEACIVRNGNVRARLQTTLPYAWDQADEGKVEAALSPESLRFLAGDGGLGDAGDAGAPSTKKAAEPIQSIEKYAELCVAELGEIPFFKKLRKGKYEDFDCRDFVGTSGAIPGVEGAMIPQKVSNADGVAEQPEKCDARNPGRYNCYSKCDTPEWLYQSCEPGPTVSSARNDKGTHWVLLCRSTQVTGGDENASSLMKTKRFNDIAMIGHNPKTGKSCFFQNKIHDGTNGGKVPHPADLAKSKTLWDSPKGYCAGCHSAEAFVHSPWIDGALRKDGTPIVPKMGVNPDFEISWNGSPYSIVNRVAQERGQVSGNSWAAPSHLVSEEADKCTSCHRIGAGQGMRRFPMWAVGEEGLDQFPSGPSGPILGKTTDEYKKFEKSHWMPPRLVGLNKDTWAQSDYAKAVEHIRKCATTPSDAACKFAPVPEKPAF